jgi:hypothetical protein
MSRNALARQEASQRLRARRELLDFMELVKPQKVINYAANESLPAVFGRWSDEQLQAAVTYFKASPEGPKPVAIKTTKAAVAAAAATYLISFPTAKPQQAQATIMADGGTVPESTDDTTYFLVKTVEDLKGVDRKVQLALVNATRTTPIKKFADDAAAADAAFQALSARAQPTKAKAKAKAEGDAAPGAAKGPKLIDYPAKDKDAIKQVRAGTKVATAIDLLGQEGGILLSDLEAELSKTGKPVSARAWLGYDVKTVVGYGVRSEVDGDDLRVFLVLPKGMKAPLAHKVVEAKPVKETAVAKAAKATKAVAEAAEAAVEAVAEVAAVEAKPDLKVSAGGKTRNVPGGKPGRESKSTAKSGK